MYSVLVVKMRREKTRRDAKTYTDTSGDVSGRSLKSLQMVETTLERVL